MVRTLSYPAALAILLAGMEAAASPPVQSVLEDGFTGVALYQGQAMAMNQVGFTQVSATWVAPTIAGAPSKCTAFARYAPWVGLQRTGSDVLQAGFAANTPCGGGQAQYSVFYNWYWCPGGGCVSYGAPQAEQMSVKPGDVVSAWVWYSPKDGLGHALILDVTTGDAVGGSIKPPFPANAPPMSPCCSTAEWIVEGDTVETGATAPFRSLVMLDAWAIDAAGAAHSPGGDDGAGTYLIQAADGTATVELSAPALVRFSSP